MNGNAPTIFTGAQVMAICNKILDDSAGFMTAATTAATPPRQFEKLREFFSGQTSWTPEQQQTLMVLATTFRRYAAKFPDDARRIVEDIRDNCRDDAAEGDYVHW